MLQSDREHAEGFRRVRGWNAREEWHGGNGIYVITERGEHYLDGELNTSEDAPDASVN
jgi:hypothetical protein